jgi:hypothetical protein
MMLLSDRGVIKVFPNWVSNRDAKFVGLREKGAFLLSSEYNAQNKEVLYVDLFSEAGKQVTIASPWPEGILVTDESGAKVDAISIEAPNHPGEITIQFNTQSGKTYHIVKSDEFPPLKVNKPLSETIDVRIFPNPGSSGSTVYIDTGNLTGENVNIYDITGHLMQRIPVVGQIVPVIINTPGIYMVVIKEKNGITKTKKSVII